MKKANRKSLNALRKSVSNKTQAAAPAFKVNGKHVLKIVAPVVAAVMASHEGIRTAVRAWKGEHPETLDAAIVEFKAACKKWLKGEGRKVNPQSVYNLQSDIIAVARAYQKYAGMNDNQRKTFDREEAKASSYHTLIKFARDTNKVKGGSAKAVSKSEAKRKRFESGWKNRKSEMLKSAQDYVRYAPTEMVLKLADFCEAIIKARKSGNVERLQAKQRKAA